MFSRLAYWLSALGYDLRDRSFTNRIYLVYFCAFWFVWVIVVFALLGSSLAGLFDEIQVFSPPPDVVVTLSGITLIVWALVILWQVSRRSPFVFNEDDAYLLCQAPVSRRKVRMIWFLQGIIGALLLSLAGFLLSGLGPLLSAPLSPSLRAAFLEGLAMPDRLASLGLGLLYLLAGLAFLSLQSGSLHLSRAARETSHLATFSLARSYGQTDLVGVILLRRRLGTTRRPSRLLYQPAGNILFWKDLLQTLRTLRLRDVFNLVWIFGLSLGMFRSSNLALQMLLAGVWTISIGGLTTRRLQSDLARWWLLRSLPLRPAHLLKGEVFLSCGVYSLPGWLALAFSDLTPIFGLYAALLLPILVVNAALATAHDILNHSQARVLMSPSLAEENVPRQNIWGALQALVSVLIPFGILLLSSAPPGQPVWEAAAFPVAAFITWLNRKAVLSTYHWIE